MSSHNNNLNGTTHGFHSQPLSAMGWSLLRQITTQARHGKQYLTAEEVAAFKQTTMGGFARRGYIKRVANDKFRVTELAMRARSEYDAADVMRQAESAKISVYFERHNVVAMRKAG